MHSTCNGSACGHRQKSDWHGLPHTTRLLLIVALLYVTAVFFGRTHALAATLTVGVGQNYATIVEAISAADPYDEILVYDGTYIESISVSKPLTLQSHDWVLNGENDGALVTASTEDNTAIRVTSDNVVIQGLNITGATCITVNGQKTVRIANNRCGLEGGNRASRCIWIGDGSEKIEIEGNSCDASSEAIQIDDSKEIRIRNNDLTAASACIDLDHADSNLIENNICRTRSMRLRHSDYNRIIGNTCEGMDGNSVGADLLSSHYNLIWENNFDLNRDGIILGTSNGNSIAYNSCCENSSDGIFVLLSENNRIVGNRLNHNQAYGICFNTSTNNEFFLNSLEDNGASNTANNAGNINHWFSQASLTYSYGGTIFRSPLGNYYGDHNNADGNGNGIADQPRIQPGNSTIFDYYPLSRITEYYGDVTEPVLTLADDQELVLEIYQYADYPVASISAVDDFLGDISPHTGLVNGVDGTVSGTFEELFAVCDLADNCTEIPGRDITVLPALWVGSLQAHTTIQSAVDQAADGTTIIVMDGQYRENVFINRQVALYPESWLFDGLANGATLIPASTDLPTIEVRHADVTIEGFRFTQATNDAGILMVDDALNGSIEHNTFEGNRFGIVLNCSETTNACRLAENTFTQNEFGIYLYGTHGNLVSTNMFSQNDNGIVLDNANHNTVKENQHTGEASYAIVVYQSSSTVLELNHIKDSSYGILIEASTVCDVNEDALENNEIGLIIYQSDQTHVQNALVQENAIGIVLDSSTDNAILQSNFQSNETGVFFYKSSSNTVAESYFHSNDYDIRISESGYNDFHDNQYEYTHIQSIYYHDDPQDSGGGGGGCFIVSLSH